MKILNNTTQKVHVVESVMNVEDKDIFFTEDGLCFPCDQVTVLVETTNEVNDTESFSAEEVGKKWLESKLGGPGWVQKREKVVNKIELGYLKMLGTPNFLKKYFNIWVEDNSSLPETTTDWRNKKSLFKINNKSYFLVLQ